MEAFFSLLPWAQFSSNVTFGGIKPMKTFKMMSLTAAVVAGLGALGVAGAANAVHVNPDGLGKALVATPYFTVKDDTNTAAFLSQQSNNRTDTIDNSCAGPRAKTKAKMPQVNRQNLMRAVNHDPWMKQKAKANSYQLDRTAAVSTDRRDYVSLEMVA